MYLTGTNFWYTFAKQWERFKSDLFIILYLIIAATLMTVYLYQQASIIIGPKSYGLCLSQSYSYYNFIIYFRKIKVISQKVAFGIILSTIVTILLLI